MLQEFTTAVAQLCWASNRDGDREFAAALKKCFLMATGADMECPMGRLTLDRTIERGEAQCGPMTRAVEIAPNGIRRRRLDREGLMSRVIDRIGVEAAWRKDLEFLAALDHCRDAMSRCAACPLRDVLDRRPTAA